MNRRTFTKITVAGSLASTTGVALAADAKGKPFKSKFGPHYGQLPTAPKGYIDQMQFAYDLGFRGWEENWLTRRPKEIWEKVGEFCKDKGMSLGISVITTGHGLDFSNPGKEGLAKLEADMKKGIELAKATGQTCMTFLPGCRNDKPREEQIAKAVDSMKFCCDLVEDAGIILVQEPLSHNISKKPPLIRSFADGHLLCKLVNRKSCKLLADFYHEGQIGFGGKLVENGEAAWDQIAYVQYGDSPGRKEPGTGKLELGDVTKWLRKKGYDGVIGMEHGVKGKKLGKQGLDDLIAAYRAIDA
ncbi:MAG: sugar phosphate isomerase/epimerase [Verrucomicrobiae bacterium]|nr:sugar phosphate isomerase/epimerase [Verrucomicrobiae bacterium]NNJ87463.1 TIM barrel protein [Akkermansiaceae bacterium]